MTPITIDELIVEVEIELTCAIHYPKWRIAMLQEALKSIHSMKDGNPQAIIIPISRLRRQRETSR